VSVASASPPIAGWRTSWRTARTRSRRSASHRRDHPAPTPAFALGSKVDDPLAMYLSDVYTIAVNLAGLPAMSIPCGQSSNNLPIGLQLMGNHFDEATLLNVAHQFQHTTDHHLKHPTL